MNLGKPLIFPEMQRLARPALSGMTLLCKDHRWMGLGVLWYIRDESGDISYLQMYVLYSPKSEFKHLSVHIFEQNLTASLMELPTALIMS